MATLLYRLGRFCFDRRRAVLGAWLLVLVVMGALSGTVGKTSDAEITIPGVESVEASELLSDRFEDPSAGGATARVVFAVEDGAVTDPEHVAAIEKTLADVADGAMVASVTDPFTTGTVSADGRVAFATVAYAGQAEELSQTARDDLTDAVESASSDSLRVEVGGEATQAPVGMTIAELIGVVVALVVLTVTFGSMIAAGMPLLTAILGVAIGGATVFALSSVVDMTSTTPMIGLLLGLAVGIDYALFITSRHKQHLAEGMTPREAAAMATGTAGSAVVFAGATVMVALAGLTLIGIPFMTTMGLVAAGMVGIAVLVALTLIPAMLGFAGAKFNSGTVGWLRGRQERLRTAEPFGARWARGIARRPVAVLVTAVVGTLALAVPLLDLRLGLPDEGHLQESSSQRQAYDLVSEGFGPGFNGPLTLVVDTSAEGGSATEAGQTLVAALSDLDDVAAVVPGPADAADETAIVQVVPESGPSDVETEDLVTAVRDLGPEVLDGAGELFVTGNTAVGIDVSAKFLDALPLFLLVVVGLSFLLLILAFRSILVPLKATLGFLLSVAATFGAVVAVFQWGWLAELLGVDQTGPILSFLPILLIALVFGLAMDYELFLVSRMREDFVHGETSRAAVVTGFQHGGRVVTAAALIMISVFAGSLLSHDPMLKSIGFALAFGVAVDAFVVRMTIVPAVMTLLGDKAWYLPRWLDRALPDVDVEGTRLEARQAQSVSESVPAGAGDSSPSRGEGVIG